MSFNFSQDLLSETCPQTQPPPSQPQELEPAAPVPQQHLQEDRVSQDSGYLGSWEAPGARRMAARPPTWPSVPRVSQEREGRWSLPYPKAGREGGDLKHHLADLSSKVSKLPASVSGLLEEAIRFLETSQEKGQKELQERLEAALEMFGQAPGSEEGSHREDQLQSLHRVHEEIIGLVEAQKEVTKDIVRQQTELVAEKSSEIRNELEKNCELIQKLRTLKKESMSRQTEPTVARKTLRLKPSHMEGMKKEVRRPLLTPGPRAPLAFLRDRQRQVEPEIDIFSVEDSESEEEINFIRVKKEVRNMMNVFNVDSD